MGKYFNLHAIIGYACNIFIIGHMAVYIPTIYRQSTRCWKHLCLEIVTFLILRVFFSKIQVSMTEIDKQRLYIVYSLNI